MQSNKCDMFVNFTIMSGNSQDCEEFFSYVSADRHTIISYISGTIFND